MAVALRGKRYLRGVIVFVVAELVIGLCVADVAASEVSINKINSPRDVTHTLPGGFPFLLHISEASVPPRCEWSCCLLQVADLLGVVAAALLMRLPSGGARPPGFALAAGVSDGLAVLLELAKRSRVGADAQLAVGFMFGAKKLAGGPFIYAGINLAWIFLDAMLVGFLHAADLRPRRCKRPWGPPALPWGPPHVLPVWWRPDAWHAAACRGRCSSIASLWAWDIRGWHACFGQVNFLGQFVVLFICRYGNGKAVVGARVDRQPRLMPVLRFGIGDYGPILLNPVKPSSYLRFKTTILEDTGRSDSRGERRLGYRSARTRTLDTSIVATSRWPSGPDGPRAPDGSVTHVFRCMSTILFTCLSYVIWEFVFPARCRVP